MIDTAGCLRHHQSVPTCVVCTGRSFLVLTVIAILTPGLSVPNVHSIVLLLTKNLIPTVAETGLSYRPFERSPSSCGII